MSSSNLETFVILPYLTYKALDQRAKKAEGVSATHLGSDEPPTAMGEPPPLPVEPSSKDEVGKDVVVKYKTSQMKKLLHHIQETSGSKEILDLPNLDELIKSALGSSRKNVPHERQFFTWLFNHSLSAYVRNRSKINQYYQPDQPWYQV